MEKSKKSRLEKIRKEIKSAEEYGYSPPDFIPLSDNFRVEGLMKAHYIQEEELNNLDSGIANGVMVSENPFKVKLDSKCLIEMIKSDCKSIDQNNRGQLGPVILENFQKLAQQTKSYSKIKSLHEDVLLSVFGNKYFDNSGDASKDKLNK